MGEGRGKHLDRKRLSSCNSRSDVPTPVLSRVGPPQIRVLAGLGVGREERNPRQGVRPLVCCVLSEDRFAQAQMPVTQVASRGAGAERIGHGR